MRTIALCASMKFAQEFINMKSELRKLGITAYIPGEFDDRDILEKKIENFSVEEEIKEKQDNDYTRKHFRVIDQSDAILVLNYVKNGIKGYIGGNSFLEMGHAFANNKPIFLLQDIPEMSYTSEIGAMNPIVINNNLSKIADFFNTLPKCYLTSESVIKLQAAAFGIQRFSGTTNIIGKKTVTSIPNQPIGLQQTLDGAVERLENLKKEKLETYEYLISLENGLIFDESQKIYFDAAVCVIENNQGKREIGLSSGMLISKDIIFELLENNLELGPVIMEKYDISEKDPVVFYTHGKVKRTEVLEEVIFQTLCRFDN